MLLFESLHALSAIWKMIHRLGLFKKMLSVDIIKSYIHRFMKLIRLLNPIHTTEDHKAVNLSVATLHLFTSFRT